jgi:hypothetical protein
MDAIGLPNSTMDIGELLRQKRIRDLLQIQRQSSVDPSAPSQIPTVDSSPAPTASPVGPGVAPSVAAQPSAAQPPNGSAGNVTPPDPSLYQVPASTEALRAKVQQAPDMGQYHPSKLRQIFAGLSGMGAQIQTGSPQAGEAAKMSQEYSPFTQKQAVYQQQLGNVKALSDIDQSIQQAKQTGVLEAAKVAHEQSQSRAEEARRVAEEQRARREGKEADILPPDWATKRDFELQKEALAHPGAGAKEPTNEFELWHQQNPNSPASEWLDLKAKKDPGTKQEFTTFYNGYKSGHPKATDDQIVRAYADATTKAPITNMVIPQEGGGAKVIGAKSGTVLPAGAMTAQQMGGEQVSRDKEIEGERVAKKKAGETYQTAQRLVDQAEKAKDPSTAATADAALVMQLAGAIKPDALGKLRWNQSEQDFLIKRTRSLGGDVEALASKAAGGEHVILTSAQRKAFLETMKNIAAGPESVQQGAPAAGASLTKEDLRKKYKY